MLRPTWRLSREKGAPGSGLALQGATSLNIVAVLRILERLLAVGIGGMSIFLGYRLFLALPNVRDATGEFHLPMDIRVVLGRVGPGAFFALFGAAVVALSFYSAVHYDLTASATNVQAANVARMETRSFAGLGSQPSGDGAGATSRADARALLRLDMAELNTLAGKLRNDLSASDRAAIDGLVRRVKLKLLRPVWESSWGDPAAFEDWLASGRPLPPAALTEPAALYSYGAPPERP